MRILIAGGGTGGHVVPALAIGRRLRDRYGAEVRFVGTARGLEARMVPEAGFALELVRSGQWNNVRIAVRARTVMDVPRGVLHCIRLLRSFRPCVVVGVGGYASGPAMLAALLLRIPTLVYEPNAVPGLTNRTIGKHVSAAAVSYEETRKFFRNAEVTGVPVRAEIFAVPELRAEQPPRLLVTAGSNGAKVFNDVLPSILPALLAAVPGLTVVHQTGLRQHADVVARYAEMGLTAPEISVSPFLEDMPAQLAAATLVLARSGSTVAELAASGRPGVLVPFPQAADDHQRKNAQALAAAGAAVMILQPDANAQRLLAELQSLLGDMTRLQRMGTAAKVLARPQALENIAERIVSLCSP